MKERYYKKKASSILASIIVIITSLIILSTTNSSNVSAETSTATIRVKSTCSMTATVNADHTASLINGIYSGDYVDTTDNNNKPYENGIGQTTIQTFCNDPYGYAIYAIGYTGGDEGVANNRNTVLHSGLLGNGYDIPTGTATSGDTSNWAMKLASVTGDFELDILSDSDGSYANYHKIPSSYTKVAQYDNGTDPTAISASLTTTYAAYISNTQPAGTYTGQVKYILVHPSNSLGPDYNTMQDVDQWANTIEIGEEVVAYDNRDNKSYTVRRMCMNGNTTGSTWQEKEDNCAWEDSMLWMTQNLDLDLDSSVALNSINTDLNDVGSGAYVDGYGIDSNNIIYWRPTNSTITNIDSSMGKFNGWVDSQNTAYSSDPDNGDPDNPWYTTGDLYNSNQCRVGNSSQTCNYLNATVAQDYFGHAIFISNGSHGKVGNYYNWSAAIASNNSNSYNTSTYDNVKNNNPKNSICPRGWRLPTTSNEPDMDEFTSLNNFYNNSSTSSGISLIESPVYMIRAGYVNGGGGLSSAGYGGGYWSSTVNSASQAYQLYFRSFSASPTDNDTKSVGWSIRCVSDY